MHSHNHDAPASAGMLHRRRLVVVLAITAGIVVVQNIGGVASDS
jgi:Co/Zn/Cd efflux system component